MTLNAPNVTEEPGIQLNKLAAAYENEDEEEEVDQDWKML